MAIYRSDTDQWLWWVFDNYGDILSPWSRILSGQYSANDTLILNTAPAMYRSGAAIVDLFGNAVSGLARSHDHVVFGQSGSSVIALRNVEYVTTYASNVVDFYQLDHFGFTTDGSIRLIEANIGNHIVTYETAARDSSLNLGDGFDRVIVTDDPDVGIVTYWTIRREYDNSVIAYALSTGNVVEIEGGEASRYATVPGMNYGEVERLTYTEYRTGNDIDLYLAKGDIVSGYDRAGFENIDLSTLDMSSSPDTFLHSSFGTINYSSRNVFVGAAVIEEWNGTDETAEQQSAASRFSTTSELAADHNHDLLVAQQEDEIDGHLRLYVRDENSRTYNRFNEVYLGTSADNSNQNTGSTTSRNGTAEQIIHTAMYGFDGNDLLQSGSGNDYLFGGTSTYSTIATAGNFGNQLTGGDGNDHFGVGNISAGADGDAIMTTNFTARLYGTAPLSTSDSGKLARLDGAGTGSTSVTNYASDTADLATRVATDRITDWTAGSDYLRVLANGTAIIEGLGTANGVGGAYGADAIGSDAERIDLSGGRVNNEGKIVARGLGGVDTLVGSSGDDWLYGNAATNYYSLGSGGHDRVYVDQFDGSRSKHYVEGFTKSTGLAADTDLVFLNKRIIDAFYSGGAARAALKLDVDAAYSGGQAYSAGVNYLYNSFYSGSYSSSNTTHRTADGGAYWEGGTGADGTSSFIGLGMAIAGRGMFAIPFVGPIIGLAMIAASIPIEGLGFDPSPTREHLNATYDGTVNAYLNVLTDSYGGNGVTVNSTVGVNDSGIRFLDFFQNSNTGDGYLPVVEFTANSGGIYGYFALHSYEETFVYLVASSDNMVENAEALFVAEINGRLTAADFGIYDGERDVYNYGTIPTIIIRSPSLTTIADSATPTADQAMTDGILADVRNPIVISGTVSGEGALSVGSYFRVYDGANKIYDGDTAVSGQQVTLNLSGTSFAFTDSRPLGTTVKNTTNTGTDDTFVLSDAYVRYTVELVDGETGIPKRVSADNIKVSGGNATIDGGNGSDILLVTETSVFLNGVSDARLVGMERIVLSGPVTIVASVQTQTPISIDLTNQTEGFEVISGSAGDTIVASSGNDTIFGVGGADSILAGSGNDAVVYSTTYHVVTTTVNNVETNTTTDTIDATAASNLATDLTVDGGDGVDTLRFDTDRYDENSTLMFSAPVVLTDAEFAKVIRFENLALNGTGTQQVTLGANANAAFATGITVTTALTATSLNFDASSAAWTRTTNVTGTNNADTITGGLANDTLVGGAGNDSITSGTGNDSLSGGDDADRFVLAGNLTSGDVISGGGGGTNTDTLTFTDANGAADDLDNVTGIETITLGNTTTNVVVTTVDALVASGATLTVNGSALTTGTMTWNGSAETNGKFNITGGGADDTIIGGAGNDTINGGLGADSITSGAGNDSLIGDAGDDLFVFTATNSLTADDTVSGGTHTLGDTVRVDLTGSVTFTLDADFTGIETLVLNDQSDDTSDASVTLAAAFAQTSLVIDGSTMDAGQVLTVDASANSSSETISVTSGAGDDILTGGAGNDTINGGAGADTITGGAGNDSLIGDAGDDLFVFTATNSLTADDTVSGGTHTLGDTVRVDLTGSVTFTLDADFTGIETLVLNDQSDDTSDASVTLDAAFAQTSLVIDGSTMDAGQVLTVDASANSSSETISVTSGAGDDILTGGAGNDTINGGAGADTITAGTGNDSLSGGDDADTFVLASNLTSGDVISGGDGGTNTDTLIFTDANSAASDLDNVTGIETITLENTGTNVVVTTVDALVASGATLTVDGTSLTTGTMAWDGSAETNGKFNITGGGAADVIIGGAGNDTINGGAGNDSITGGAGNDYLVGNAGDDVFVFDATNTLTGDDTISGTANDTLGDTVRVDLTGSVSFTLDADFTGVETLVLNDQSDDTSDASVTLDAAFAQTSLVIDGSTMDAGQVLTVDASANSSSETISVTSGGGDDSLTGGAANDTLGGGAGADTITGGDGNDSINGGAGNDVLVYASAAALAADGSVVGGNDTDTIRMDTTTSALTLVDSDFTNVTEVERLDLTGTAAQSVTLGAETNQAFANGLTLTTVATATSLNLQGGLSTVSITATGTNNADTLLGGSAADSLTGGSGANSIDGAGGNDTIVWSGTGNNTISGGDGNDFIDPDADQSGNDYITGNDGNDTIYSGGGSDTILGGVGDDSLFGEAGPDTIWAGAGGDVVTASGDSETDKVLIVGDLSTASVAKINLINTTLAGMIGYNPGLTTAYTTDVAAGESIAFDAGGTDELHMFGTVDLTGVTITGSYVAYSYSRLTLTQAQLSQATEINFVGNLAHELVVADNTTKLALSTDEQLQLVEDWLNAAGKQTGFVNSAQDFVVAGKTYQYDSAGGGFTAEVIKAQIPSLTPAGSPIGAVRNSSTLQIDRDGDGFGDNEAVTVNGAHYQIVVGDKFAGTTFVSYFEPGTTNLPVPDTLRGTGDNRVHNSQYEVYYGSYDLRTGVFTVTSTPYSPSQSQYTLILYDNDSSSSVGYVEGIVFANYMTESNWSLANGGTTNATLSYPSGSTSSSTYGTSGANTLSAADSGAAEYLYGLAGNDSLTGNGGGDFLIAGVGADTVTGGSGANLIDLGDDNSSSWTGNGDGAADTLVVNAVSGTSSESGAYQLTGSGADTGQDYVFNFEFGTDILKVVASNVSDFDHGSDAVFGTAQSGAAGSAAGFTTSTVLVDLNGNGLIGTGDVAVSFENYASTLSTSRLQYVLTGTSGADAITTGALDDTITGGAGADTVTGGAGNDTYKFTATASSGEAINDAVNGGSVDTLYLDGSSIDMTALRINGGAAGGALNGAGGSQEGIDLIVIKTGQTATFTAEQLAGTSVTVNKTYNMSATTLNLTGATGTQSFAGLVFTAAGAGDAFDNVEDRVQINIAGSGTNVITGTSRGDTFIAGAQTGTLSINGGSGTDEFQATADLTLTGWTSVENLKLVNDGTDVSISSSLLSSAGLTSVTGNTSGAAMEYLIVTGSASADTIDFSAVTFTDAAVSIDGGNGTDSLVGGSGNDYINGGADNDTLVGGTGVDTLVGGTGNDVFVFGIGSTDTTDTLAAMDVITDFTADDRLDLTAFSITSGPTATLASGSDGDDYVVSWVAGGVTNYIYLENTAITGGLSFTNTSGSVAVGATLAGAPAFDVFTVGASGLTVSGDSPYRAYFHDATYTPLKSDTVDGTNIYSGSNNKGASATYTFATAVIGAGTSVFSGEISLVNTNSGAVNTSATLLTVGSSSADTINGSGAIYGFGGDDTIVAGSGADYISGGAGNDSLTGGSGSDIFIFSSSATNGSDTITDFTKADDKFNFSAVGPGTFTLHSSSIVAYETANTNVTDKVVRLFSALPDSSSDLDTAAEISAEFGSGQSLGLSAGGSAIIIAGEDVMSSGAYPAAYVWHVHDQNSDGVVSSSEVTLLATLSSFNVGSLDSSNFIL